MKLQYAIDKAHVHECERCGTRWAHDPRPILLDIMHAREADRDMLMCAIGPEELMLAQMFDPHFECVYEVAHDCPQCGTETTRISMKLDDVHMLWDGVHCRPWTTEDYR